MEFNSFAASSSDEDSRFWIRSTQVGQQVPRSQLFAFELPTDEDFKDQLTEEHKQQVSRPPRHLKTKTKTAPRQQKAVRPPRSTLRSLYARMDVRMDSQMDDIDRLLDEIDSRIARMPDDKESANMQVFKKLTDAHSKNRFLTKWVTETSAELKQLEVCPICIESFRVGDKVLKLSCGHVFHYSCIETWFHSKAECPKCRKHFK